MFATERLIQHVAGSDPIGCEAQVALLRPDEGIARETLEEVQKIEREFGEWALTCVGDGLVAGQQVSKCPANRVWRG